MPSTNTEIELPESVWPELPVIAERSESPVAFIYTDWDGMQVVDAGGGTENPETPPGDGGGDQ
jgi:hypothetical protein